MLDHDTDSYEKISRAFVDGQAAGHLTRDRIVDNITLYWLTGTGASAAREFWESAATMGDLWTASPGISGTSRPIPPRWAAICWPARFEAAGVAVLSSCTEGTCGTCETAVISGRPGHRDSVLTPAERAAADTMMICLSRSMTSRLTLEL
jgi:hypothetical protein